MSILWQTGEPPCGETLIMQYEFMGRTHTRVARCRDGKNGVLKWQEIPSCHIIGQPATRWSTLDAAPDVLGGWRNLYESKARLSVSLSTSLVMNGPYTTKTETSLPKPQPSPPRSSNCAEGPMIDETYAFARVCPPEFVEHERKRMQQQLGDKLVEAIGTDRFVCVRVRELIRDEYGSPFPMKQIGMRIDCKEVRQLDTMMIKPTRVMNYERPRTSVVGWLKRTWRELDRPTDTGGCR